MHCGPFSRENTEGTDPCCPGDGLWTEWTPHFFRNDAKGTYQKTRKCLSAPAGCPCTGAAVQEQTQCPCPTTLKNADVCAQIDPSINQDYKMDWFRDLVINDTDCTAILWMEANNDLLGVGGLKMCQTMDPYLFVPALILLLPASETQGPSNKCYVDRPFNCEERGTGAKDMTVPFTCDLDKLMWRYDYTGWFIEGYHQPAFNVTK
uniref:Uncharacterized protein n=1 Tax=Caenorhabditis japonica TaxID=281687 RepID=A0A8R1DUP7_CAEJA